MLQIASRRRYRSRARVGSVRTRARPRGIIRVESWPPMRRTSSTWLISPAPPERVVQYEPKAMGNRLYFSG